MTRGGRIFYGILAMGVFFEGVALPLSAVSASEGGDLPAYDSEGGGLTTVRKIERTEDEWRKQLTPEQYRVTRKKGTELPFSGRFNHHREVGVYRCVGCDLELFRSDAKYDSRTGWPSFWEPIAPENIATENDRSFFMTRTEVHCPRCGAHLGHVFDDGPDPTGKRYCINSAALTFRPKEVTG